MISMLIRFAYYDRCYPAGAFNPDLMRLYSGVGPRGRSVDAFGFRIDNTSALFESTGG